MQKRLLIVSTAFPRWKDDFRGVFVWNLAQALSQEGFICKVVVPSSAGSLGFEKIESIEIHRMHYLPNQSMETIDSDGGGLPAFWKKETWKRILLLPYFSSLIAGCFAHTKTADVLHAHFTLSAMAIWLTRWFHRKPYIVTVHGSDILIAGKLPIIRWLTKKSLQQAAKIIAVSEFLADSTLEIIGDNSKVIVIANGFDEKTFQQQKFLTLNERGDYILFVGSLIPRKGVNVLIEAFSLISHLLPNHRLKIIGDGHEKETLQQLAHRLGVTESIDWLGNLPPADVAEYMRKAKLFVLPSLQEAFGIVLVEALAVGTPCVASNVGGISSIISDDTGVLVQAGNIPQLSQAILTFLKNENLLEEKINNAQQYAQSTIKTWRDVAFDTVEIINSVLTSENKGIVVGQ